MKNNPKSIKRISDSLLEIVWGDGRNIKIPTKLLRLNCPCASCGENRGDSSHSAPLSPPVKPKSLLTVVSADLQQETSLQQIWAIGNYAVGFRWGDGHASGIYTYSLLASMSDIVSSNPAPNVNNQELDADLEST